MSGHPALSREPSSRDLHYAGFYGLRSPDATGDAVPDDRPLMLVHGNCQAEALRVLLDGTGGGGLRAVRIPPVHELVADDVAHLQHLLGRTAVLVVQPVTDGYHGLPLGTREVVARCPGRVVPVPVLRHQLLHPHQVLVRVEGAGDPPVVPYHDLRTLVRASGGSLPPPGPAALREVGAASVAELVRREDLHGTLRASDLLVQAGPRATHTINHPGNEVLVGLARRVQRALGHPETAHDPGRTLLGEVKAPLEPDMLRANGFDEECARPDWTVRGERVTVAEVEDAQLGWYAENPAVVSAGIERHRATLELLGR